jgi:hypothetical protein
MLAVGQTIRAAFAELWARRVAFLRIILIPAVLQVIFDLATLGLDPNLADSLRTIVAAILSLMVLIAWYRHVFDDADAYPWSHWSLGNIFRTIWAAIKSLTICLLPLLLGVFIWAFAYGSPSKLIFLLASLCGIGGIVWFIYASVRLVLYLPAIALGEPVSLREAFAKTKPHVGRIFWVLFAGMVVMMLANFALLIVPALILAQGGAALVVLTLWANIAMWPITGFWLAVNTQIYRTIIMETA